VTDWIARLKERLDLIDWVVPVLGATLTAEERARLRALAQVWPPERGDPPRAMVRACLDDVPVFPDRPRGARARLSSGSTS
jgi:hypothetical protein